MSRGHVYQTTSRTSKSFRSQKSEVNGRLLQLFRRRRCVGVEMSYYLFVDSLFGTVHIASLSLRKTGFSPWNNVEVAGWRLGIDADAEDTKPRSRTGVAMSGPYQSLTDEETPRRADRPSMERAPSPASARDGHKADQVAQESTSNGSAAAAGPDQDALDEERRAKIVQATEGCVKRAFCGWLVPVIV